MTMTLGRSSSARRTASLPSAGFADDLDRVIILQHAPKPAAHQA